MSASGLSDFVRACHFAAVKHTNQRRKDEAQTPYINHPLGVANHLVDCGLSDPALLCAAVLHDTVEDTDTTFEEIKDHFGQEVEALVREVSDDKSLPKMKRKELQIEHALHASPKAKLIKLADKLYNLEDLQRCTPKGWTEDRVNAYFEWAQKVVTNCKTGESPMLEEKVQKVLNSHFNKK
ncbi:guanosine-3',5'-bis(diphosphate) 3'-pyrophosphohydrolase MESH1 [Galendromus occidentalis]|uniref:Guanosine-3',5'-bis(diphosphate) 3'-pyrophosphohydrolase MESH1 n=1 Tax=Galendromus occidentalis TaxID=34638 RepID=A0AAJ6QXX1_9ACAR|nr:guanosine-3',5'-bis(diphosphate) 3'-pyrophosphohydrolase MESH1 [Galendromus occidentalis]